MNLSFLSPRPIPANVQLKKKKKIVLHFHFSCSIINRHYESVSSPYRVKKNLLTHSHFSYCITSYYYESVFSPIRERRKPVTPFPSSLVCLFSLQGENKSLLLYSHFPCSRTTRYEFLSSPYKESMTDSVAQRHTIV